MLLAAFVQQRRAKLSMSGDEPGIIVARKQLLDILDGASPWYSRIACLDFFYVWMFLVWPVCMVIFLLSPSFFGASDLTSKIDVMPFAGRVFGLVVFLGLFVYGLGELRVKIFPRIVFTLGQGAYRQKTLENVHWCIIIGLLVSLAGSLIYSFF